MRNQILEINSREAAQSPIKVVKEYMRQKLYPSQPTSPKLPNNKQINEMISREVSFLMKQNENKVKACLTRNTAQPKLLNQKIKKIKNNFPILNIDERRKKRNSRGNLKSFDMNNKFGQAPLRNNLEMINIEENRLGANKTIARIEIPPEGKLTKAVYQRNETLCTPSPVLSKRGPLNYTHNKLFLKTSKEASKKIIVNRTIDTNFGDEETPMLMQPRLYDVAKYNFSVESCKENIKNRRKERSKDITLPEISDIAKSKPRSCKRDASPVKVVKKDLLNNYKIPPFKLNMLSRFMGKNNKSRKFGVAQPKIAELEFSKRKKIHELMKYIQKNSVASCMPLRASSINL
ncbi:unnamed protein product [Moneuplotes crassus]|uniref:Uncharacterized protein n=1 Tax=Euplotes crassus TaxID=5936 RepID=A0AAD1YCC1_EUPCR|nr:unnamed protein product [Moneuplotes crassus]